MKILMLSWNYPPAVGGMEHMLFQLHTGLARRGHRLVLLTAHHTGACDNAVAGPIHRAPRPGALAFLRFAFIRGWREIRRERPDVIFAGSLVSGPASWLLSRLFRIPYVVPAYGSDLLVPNRLYQLMARIVLRGARRVFPISEHTKRLALSRGARAERTVLITPGVDVPDLDAGIPPESLARWRAATAGRRVLLSVCRLVRRKGVLEFVRDVMPAIVARHPSARLLVVGDDAGGSLIHREKMTDQIRAAIRERGLDDAVHLLGRVSDEDLRAIYACAELFVMPVLDLPHDVEGFGIVLLEAGLVRVPSVATRVGGIPDAVEDGATGILVPAGDPAAMAEAVLRMLDNDALRRRMGQAAADRACNAFRWDVIVNRYDRALREAVPGPG